MTENKSKQYDDDILKKLHELEQRITALENRQETSPVTEAGKTQYDKPEPNPLFTGTGENLEEVLETRFGRYGLLWVGNLVLIMGFIILTQFFISKGKDVTAAITGFGSAALLFGITTMVRRSVPYVAKILRITTLFLTYFFTVRLYYFTDNPILPQAWVCLTLLLTINLLQNIQAIKNRSVTFAFLAVLFSSFTAILGDHRFFTMAVSVGTGFVALYFYYFRLHFKSILIISILLVYTVFFLWLFGNPLAGHPFHINEVSGNNLFFVIIAGIMFSAITLFPDRPPFAENFLTSAAILNMFGFSFLLLLNIVAFHPENFVLYLTAIFSGCLAFSVFLKFNSNWKFAAPYYAIYSFIILSWAIYGYYNYDIHGSFFMLSLQSLLVLSMALWYKSRFITVMNLFMFMFLLITYLIISGKLNTTNFSFAIIALISARIIHMKEDRLKIKTSFIRNTYLLVAFILMLYSLYHSLPYNYISMAWIGLAVVYFLISILLHNQKYRWMSIGTLVTSAVYLFIAGQDKINPTYKVIGFISLAAVSIIISVSYARKHHFVEKAK